MLVLTACLSTKGYPLEVQHQIFERSFQEFKRNIWDQSLTYGHYNLHNASLWQNPIGLHSSFADYCLDHQILILAAAPLSMGLLTHRGPPEWHPASSELKHACQQAALICKKHGVDISTLALLVALSNPRIPCTILGMGYIDEVKAVHAVALRFQGVSQTASQGEILEKVLKEEEAKALEVLRDLVNGPFASVASSGLYRWDGTQGARNFWKQLRDKDVVEWQTVEK
jgi:Aldo/keto reductase family